MVYSKMIHMAILEVLCFSIPSYLARRLILVLSLDLEFQTETSLSFRFLFEGEILELLKLIVKHCFMTFE